MIYYNRLRLNPDAKDVVVPAAKDLLKQASPQYVKAGCDRSATCGPGAVSQAFAISVEVCRSAQPQWHIQGIRKHGSAHEIIRFYPF